MPHERRRPVETRTANVARIRKRLVYHVRVSEASSGHSCDAQREKKPHDLRTSVHLHDSLGYKSYRREELRWKTRRKTRVRLRLFWRAAAFVASSPRACSTFSWSIALRSRRVTKLLAGALNGLNYKSRQIGRANRVNLAFCNQSAYMGAQSLITTGSMVGYDFMLNDVQDRLDPFDNDAYLANPMEMYACATDVMFGTAAYLPVRNATLDIDAVRASTSLPLVYAACRDRRAPVSGRWRRRFRTG